MYRAHRWKTAVSVAFKESAWKPSRASLRKEINGKKIIVRNNIVSAGRSGFNLIKFAVSGIIATSATVGAAIFYAGRDDKLRDDIEGTVPLAKEVITFVHGEKRMQEDPMDDSKSLLRIPSLGKMKSTADSVETDPMAATDDTESKEDDSSPDQAKGEASERTINEQPPNNVLVITTIDDQAAVSSVDLDISNATSKPKKKKKSKKKSEKQEKKVEDEDKKVDANPIKEAEGNTLVAANVGAKVAEEAVDNHESKVENSDQPISEQQLSDEQPINDEAANVAELIDKAAIETQLQLSVERLRQAQDLAVQRQHHASEKLSDYSSQLVKVTSLDDGSEAFDEEWKAASNLEQQCQTIIEEAKDAELKTQSEIEGIYELIESAKGCGFIDIADSAQEIATKASLELIEAADDVRKASEHLLEISRQSLVTEEAARREVLPFLESADSQVDQTPQANKVMLTFAIKKIELLKRDLDNLRAEERETLERKLQEVKEEENKKTEAQLQMQEETLRSDFEALLQKKEADLLEEFEAEMRKQLKRQSAAHRDHLTDVLQTHAEKLAAEHKEELEQELRRQSLEHGSEMNEVMSHARGVGSMIDSVIDVEKKNRRMRDLWLAVQSLSSVLNEERSAGRTKNLLPEIGAIAKHSGNNETVQFILGTIPECAAIQGVSTEEGLRKRFADVKRNCKRVAMVGDNEGSLWTYILSAVRSLVVFETHAKRDIAHEIDPDALRPYEIFAKAQHCIDEGDLELAVKFMSLLEGLPRKLAGDWIKEARSYLETRQASEFLLAYISSEAPRDDSN